jgi:hypothetical protein
MRLRPFFISYLFLLPYVGEVNQKGDIGRSEGRSFKNGNKKKKTTKKISREPGGREQHCQLSSRDRRRRRRGRGRKRRGEQEPPPNSNSSRKDSCWRVSF